MKKLMIAAAIVCAAAMSYGAAAVSWQSGTGVKDVTGNDFTALSASGYTAAITFFGSDGTTEFAPGGTTTATAYNAKGGAAAAGFSGTTLSAFDGGDYYAQLTITAPNGKVYTSDLAKFYVTPGTLSSVTINFTSGLNIGGQSKVGDTSYKGGEPEPIPEPTSGLLLLLGVAGLALKRKCA